MINLILRRIASLLVDFVLLSVLPAVISFAAIIGQIDIESDWNVIFLFIVISYFTLFETFYSGKTLGKYLFKIRVRNISNQPLKAYECCARISLLLLLPEAVNLFKGLLVASHLISTTSIFRPIFSMAAWIVWPVSTLIGRGRIAINDLLWNTEVVPFEHEDKICEGRIPRNNLWVIIFATFVISIILAKIVFTPFIRSNESFFDKLNLTEKSWIIRIAESAEDLSLHIENGTEFILNDSQIFLWTWNINLWKEWAVSQSVIPLPDEVKKGCLKFDVYAQYIISVTRRGFSSSMFQQVATQELFNKAMQPGLFMTVEYVYNQKIFFFSKINRKRLIGFLYKDNTEEVERYRLFILEPDKPTEVFYGLVF